MQPEQLHFFAHDPAAPQFERLQARAELEKIYAPTFSELPSQADMAMIRDAVLEWQADEQFAKATQLQPRLVSPKSPREPKSVIVDELSGNCMAGGYWERPGMFGFDHLRLLVENTPVTQGVILRRQRQISRFLRTWERGRDLYFEVRRSDDRNPGQGNRDKEEMALEQFALHSGWERNPIRIARLGREPMTATVSKGVRDLLTYGCWAIETVNTRNGRMIDGFNTIDASTCNLASEQGYDGDDQVMAVQVVNGIPQTTYGYNDLVYTLLDPRSDVRCGGYGYVPPEMLVKIATGWLNAMTYNLSGFDKSAIPKGLLTVIGFYDVKQSNAFKRQWNAMVKGVNNQWSLPVLFSDTKEGGAEFTKFGIEFDEMYFSRWMVWLTAMIALIYGMDPVETQ